MSQVLNQFQAQLSALETANRQRLFAQQQQQQNIVPSTSLPIPLASLLSLPDPNISAQSRSLTQQPQLFETGEARSHEVADTLALENKKQRKLKEREHRQPRESKERRQRNLKNLVAVCKQLGDTSDKSALLAKWHARRKSAGWNKSPNILRLRKTIHNLALRLERHGQDLQNQKGKARNIVRERYWEASPFTSKEDLLDDFVFPHDWTPVAFESWTLFIETQILIATLGVNLTLIIKGDWEADALEDDAIINSDFDSSASEDNAASDTLPNYGDMTSYEDSPRLAYYRLASSIKIPLICFAARTLLELQRMSKMPNGAAPAFQLILTMHVDVLYQFCALRTFEIRLDDRLDEVQAFLLHRLTEEAVSLHPESSLDCAAAVQYINDYVTTAGGKGCAHALRDLLEPLWPLTWRDLRREYRANLYLAVGRRLPGDIREVVLDWVEAAHHFPKSQEDYISQLESGGSDDEDGN